MSPGLIISTNMSSFKHIKPNSADHHPSSATTNHHHHHTLVKEHMFEKRLTPSDVGKLNRLVIPKQFAEKYLPLVSTSTAANGSLLLSFTDESGKPWKFRYSYWNSSQSYVLTKGWSRFVKEKKLDAGDVVLFQRQIVNGRSTAIMFLGWRRRSNGGRSVSSVHTDTEIKRDVKCKTFRLFGVNVESTTHEHEEFIRHHHQC